MEELIQIFSKAREVFVTVLFFVNSHSFAGTLDQKTIDFSSDTRIEIIDRRQELEEAPREVPKLLQGFLFVSENGDIILPDEETLQKKVFAYFDQHGPKVFFEQMLPFVEEIKSVVFDLSAEEAQAVLMQMQTNNLSSEFLFELSENFEIDEKNETDLLAIEVMETMAYIFTAIEVIAENNSHNPEEAETEEYSAFWAEKAEEMLIQSTQNNEVFRHLSARL